MRDGRGGVGCPCRPHLDPTEHTLTAIDLPTPAAARDAGDPPTILGFPATAWAKAGVIAALFACCFWPNLRRLWLKTAPFIGEPNWGHSIFVPVVGLYYLFVNREAVLSDGGGPRDFVMGRFLRPSRVGAAAVIAAVGIAGIIGGEHVAGAAGSYAVTAGYGLLVFAAAVVVLDWSLALILGGLAISVYGYGPGHNDFVSDAGMVVTLGGVVLVTTGPAVMRKAWFPVAFLFCALPWPPLVYSYVAEPLSQWAAHVAVWVLQQTGVDAATSGTRIVVQSGVANVPARQLNVAEACAGMRSLMMFVSAAAAIAFLSARPLWQKLVLVASAVPIAIGCNVVRISGQGLLDHYASQKWSESFAHQMVGLVMLIPAFFLILGVGWVIDQLFVIEDDDAPAVAAPPAVVVRRRAPSAVEQL